MTIAARLVDPAGELHAELEGFSIGGMKLVADEDRVWRQHPEDERLGVLKDSGWGPN